MTSLTTQTDQSICLLPLPNAYISKDLIINIFLITFNELRGHMTCEMHKLKSLYISCDHTFKMASHVDVYKDGKWVPQYDSLFIVQNELGLVVFWQLTKGTAYGSIEDGIESLKSRIADDGCSLKMIMIDNCCMWKRKLQSTFGEETCVKLDIFHAVKRITTSMSKKHPYFYAALQDLRLVFRMTGDNGIYRTKSTPPPNILCSNLDAFLSKWSKISDTDSKFIITAAVLKEIDNLRVHINRGCLSDIPPSFGTNRNKNLHRSLNKRFTGNCLGVEVAVAILATFSICGTLIMAAVILHQH